jgi:hypothetical protein
MENENVGDSLSSEEQAYFESRGEAPIKTDEPEKAATPPEDTAVELDEPDDTEGDTQPGAEDAPAQPKTVPLAALTKTRAEAKETKAKLSETERKLAVLEGRWQQLLESQNKPAETVNAVEDQIPDPEIEPQEAIKWALNFAKEQKAEKQQAAAQTAQQQAAEREWAETYTAVNKSYSAAAEADPLINEARDYLVDSVGQEAMAMGLSREQAQAEINRVEAEHIRFAHKQGLEIGDYVKKLAKARGWTGKAKTEPQPDPKAEIEALAEGVDAATSLSTAGGGAPKTVRPQDIADMSPEQFEKWLNKNPDAFRKLAGG